MIRTLDRGALVIAPTKDDAERRNREDVIRAWRISVYAERWERLRSERPIRELLADPDATVVLGDTPPERKPGMCGFPGCTKAARRSHPSLCAGHHKQAVRRGGRAALTPLAEYGWRAKTPVSAPCVRCGGRRVVLAGKRQDRRCLDCENARKRARRERDAAPAAPESATW